ncbi:hypothetical protein B0H67DRAFT_108085 [Lasiosphaeris hirsuta]|uniref:PLL-like beta propeller domain-containing protein n=1 Tax=Lasiosphaeris hirsuta TaxID=260670 RepID=A0AA40AYW6_9PEZI|nr:hypothetical protein B0H67DRAFT_108085 [Lasiosphaeris hirsuta]
MPSDVRFRQVSGEIYFEGTPSVCYTNVDTTHVFVTGWDGTVWRSKFRSQIDQTWGPWENIGGNADANVTAIAFANYGTVIYVFARTKANTVQVTRWNGLAWDGWVDLPGVTALSSVTAVTSGGETGPPRIDLFVRDARCRILHMAVQEPMSWPTTFTAHAWDVVTVGFPLGAPPMQGTPQALVCPDNQGKRWLYLFTRAADGEVWKRRMDLDMAHLVGWEEWRCLGGAVINDPIPLILFPGAIDLISRGMRNQFAHCYCANGNDWSAWAYHEDQLSGPIASAAALAYLSEQTMTTDIVAAQGPDNRCLWRRLVNAHQEWTPWQSPTEEPTLITGPPIVIRTRETRILARDERGRWLNGATLEIRDMTMIIRPGCLLMMFVGIRWRWRFDGMIAQRVP